MTEKPEAWQVCEEMGHIGPELDVTVEWRDLGLMCRDCYVAYRDTRPLREESERWSEQVNRMELEMQGYLAEIERLRKALRLLDEFDRYASTTEYAGTAFEAEVTAYLKEMGYGRRRPSGGSYDLA
jgi:hypothetical protein